jgi:hypothetical protein
MVNDIIPGQDALLAEFFNGILDFSNIRVWMEGGHGVRALPLPAADRDRD